MDNRSGQGITLQYAQTELDYYVEQISNQEKKWIELDVDATLFTHDHFDPQWDDAYRIQINQGEGTITGSNERSVLLGVYRYLHELGCRFFRPTKQGEYIPKRKLQECTVQLTAQADYRHRGICIEGAVSLQHVIDLIEWAPKVGFNGYFLQFRDAFTFFERWYTHERNEQLVSEGFDRIQSKRFMAVIESEINKRSLIHHAVGHGWTCESIGFPSTGWHKVGDEEIPAEKRQFLAEINGKRTFFEGIPLNTQLCYSNPEAQQRMLDEIVRYVEEHRDINVLHVWLGDNFNNFCECTKCVSLSPPDHYVKLLNAVDEELTKRDLDNKIAFLIYLELLWTPEKERLNNPDRFIMMYAPIHRTYTRSFLKDGKAPDRNQVQRIKFELNKVEYPKDIESNVAFLYEWQEVFTGDSFDFDYHLMWDNHREYTGLQLAQVIYEDVQGLKELGLNGLVSCQVQRAFFPNGLSMYTMGVSLFDRSISFEEILEQYFEAAYGSHALLARTYLEKLSEWMPLAYTRNEVPMLDAETHNRFKQAVAWIDAHIPQLGKAVYDADDHNRSAMLRILFLSAHICRGIAHLLEQKSAGVGKEELVRQWKSLNQFICNHELELQSVLDVFYFTMINEGIMSHEW